MTQEIPAAAIPKLTPLQAAMELVNHAGSEEVLAAEGQYSPRPDDAARVLLLAVRPRGLDQVGDLWLSPDDLRALTSGPDGGVRAACDAMFSDRWTLAWCKAHGRLRLWRRGGLAMEATASVVHINPRRLRPARTMEVSDLRRVHGWLTDDWVRRGLDLQRLEGERLTVASKRELSAMIDPTYDAFDLVCDSSWLRQLCLDLGSVTGLPVELDEDL